MLARVDRVLLAAADAERVAGRWCELLDGEIDRRVNEPALGSRKTVVRLGNAQLEVHEPTDDGPVAQHLRDSAGPLAILRV